MPKITICYLVFVMLWCRLCILESTAYAQCTKDTDCREPRLCIKGECTAPTADDVGEAVCNFYGAPSDERIVPGIALDWMTEIYHRMGASVALSPKDMPNLLTGAVLNMQAKIDGPDRRRLILFNPEWVDDLRERFGDYAVMFVLAHELGHHINAHLARGVPKEKRRENEARADAYAARVLARMGATESQTKAAVLALPPIDASDFHPPQEDRVNNVIAEYNKTKRNSGCPAGQILSGGACTSVCSADQEWDGSKCVIRCGEGQKWDGSACVDRCPSHQDWNGKKCTDKCSLMQKWNGISCVDKCPAHQEWNGSQCTDKCPSDQRWNGQACVDRCPPHQEWNGIRCVNRCTSEEKWDGSSCVPKGYPSGWILLGCGCYGYINIGTRFANKLCASGSEVVVACPVTCYLGGFAWGRVCE